MPDSIGVVKPWKILILSILSLFASISVYFGLVYGYRPILLAQISEHRNELTNLGQEISEVDRQSFLNFYSQFVNLKSILDNHIISSSLFSFLEKNIHEGIYYTSLSLDVKNNTLTLHGTSLNFEILSSQGKTIEEINQVSQIIFDDIRTNDKGIDFEMTIILTPNFFKE